MQTYLNRGGMFILTMAALSILAIFDSGCAAQEKPVSGELTWPAATKQNHPWTRWWWMGSAVDEESLTHLLSQYQQAGIGGVEICPIYGVKGYEETFTDFLSPEWMKRLGHTLREGKRLDIGVDLTVGTGWPFGGPMVKKENASSSVILKRYELKDGKLTEPLPKEPLHYLLAVSAEGKRIDLSDKVQEGKLVWTAPAGTWTLYAVAVKRPVQKVKRAAPGGEGYVLDPYSVKAMGDYLNVFDKAFDDYQGPMPRAYFHDSFEYYGATWTPDFFAAFQSRRGYDLRDHIEALFGDGPEDTVARVMCDYHEMINDLHMDYIWRWTDWCHSKGGLSRNQAHGAPGNLVDLYGAVDIPETEIFRVVNEEQIPMLKFSSSAAHLNGRTLASSESFTWLREHFQTSPANLKEATDFLFLTGVNHIFFHGIPYSPKEAAWPGWQFYASVNFGPAGGLWHDLPAYNAYVTRCQSILQSGQADNDILLYLPIYDYWQKKEKLHMTFTVHNQDQWLYPSAFYRAAMTLWKKGYTYDAVSDKFLSRASCQDGKIVINRVKYDVIVVPHCNLIPPETMAILLQLTREGATVLFQDWLPGDVPGLADLEKRRASLNKLKKEVLPNFEAIKSGRDQLPAAHLEVTLGKGKLMVADLESMLKDVSVARESAMDSGIRFERRRNAEGFDYFFVNCSPKAFDGWMTLGKPAQSAVLMDPLFENRTGWAAIRKVDERTQVYLQLEREQSLILRTLTKKKGNGPAWEYSQASGTPIRIEGSWDVKFVDGGPVLPEGYQTTQLASWTGRDDEEAKRFFGTARYTITFDAPNEKADDWILNLGRVCQSARVTLNGVSLGPLWSEPFQLHVGKALSSGKNTLSIEVTNLAANRIRDMDQRKVNWKYFYDINVVNVNYKPFDASDWPLFDSGLLGPVTLQSLKDVDLNSQTDTVADKRHTVFVIGDSTVHNSGAGIQGWGDVIEQYFDPFKATVRNYARAGRSSRTFQTEGLWNRVLDELKPGDFVLMQFGHNDGGSLNTGRARGSLKGIGDEIEEVVIEATEQKELVRTYGWYMRKYINDTKAKGAVPIVVSPVPRDKWENGEVVRTEGDYVTWAAQVAKEQDVNFIDLNELIVAEYEKLGPKKVNSLYFLNDHTHTTPAGAKLNAEILAQALQSLKDCPLSRYKIESHANQD